MVMTRIGQCLNLIIMFLNRNRLRQRLIWHLQSLLKTHGTRVLHPVVDALQHIIGLLKYSFLVANCIYRSIRRERMLSAFTPDVDDDAEPPHVPAQDGAAVKKLPSWLEHDQALSSTPPMNQSPDAAAHSVSASPASPSQFFAPGHPGQRLQPPSLQEAVDMYFLRGYDSVSAGIAQIVVSRLDEFPLLKIGRNGVAEMRSFFISFDGTELLWKGKRGAYDTLPIRKLLGVSLDSSVLDSNDSSVARLHETRLSFLLQFSHRDVLLAARSEHERCTFLAGLLRLRDQAAGCIVGQEIWESISPVLFQIQASAQHEQQFAQTAPAITSKVTAIMGQSLLLGAAQSTQRNALRNRNSMALRSSAACFASGSSQILVSETIMQKRVVCASSDDVVIECRVQLLSDGSVIVLRDSAAHKNEEALELARSSSFEVSSSGINSHAWMSEVKKCVLQPFVV